MGSRALGIQQTEVHRYLSDTCAHTIHIHGTGPHPCNLSPASFHQFIHFSISSALLSLLLSSCVTPLPVLPKLVLQFLSLPILLYDLLLLHCLSSMRICSPVHTDSASVNVLNKYLYLCRNTLFISLLKDKILANNLIGTIKCYLKCLWRCYSMPCTGTVTCGKQSQIHKMYT